MNNRSSSTSVHRSLAARFTTTRPHKASSTVKKWCKNVKTESTFPPKGTFTKPAQEVAQIMARKDVSPGGIGSAIKMVQFFINRAGHNLSDERRRELEKARRILHDMK